VAPDRGGYRHLRRDEISAIGAANVSVSTGLPLSGVTVLSLEQAIAAPLASRHLADWGARVIKIERPGKGDFCRDYDDAVNGLSSQFLWTNRSKESIALDIKEPRSAPVLDALLERADVFIQNLAPGAAGRLGLDARTLTQKYPRLIACDLSGYGSAGPYSQKKAYDLLVQCEVGLLSINGTETEMAKSGLPVADIAAGMYLLNGILMGLVQLARTGRGMAFEVSLFDALTEWMSYPALYTHGTGRAPRRTGTRHATIVPYGPFPTADGGEVFFGVQNEREWASLCHRLLGDPSLATDQRFDTNSRRLENRVELEAIISLAMGRHTRVVALRLLDSAGIANANLNTVADFLEHPQLLSRGRVKSVGSSVGEVPSYLPAITVPGVEPVMGPVPAIGQHTAAILAELGLNEDGAS
jgi:crotonobetainyl-CoA:carnitine CoA-transferase CaiB-like acyl-CoA transferase